ncbi:serine/threonine-protein kinase [Methylorubrum extorquens]|uniref:Serine/threonine protein kinase n=1 Tax=Methylorubrum extorquens DSM 13060 TaxID=882800 RepID=H1KE83_METEX|nr:serine/threonine-protein kinase [Methylorubrum extorquens]EHP94200.1 serine/threonine protein kinase [Methylorubrum extorquens DSM 13060]
MPYHSVKQLGRGGFGVVDQVIDGAGNSFARKTLVVPATIDAAQMHARFEREIKYQSSINHENVVRIFDYNLSDNPPWFIMPLAVCNLQDELNVDRSLGGNPQSILFDILAGLEEIHRRGYLHRDLKPANILKFLDNNGQPRYALSDFGLMAVGETGTTTLTPSGVNGGTPMYQAPECAINFKRATTRSDIYSFGAILHDIFSANAKRLPHDELTVPGDLGAIVEKCTKRNGHRRYKNVEELREDLFAALNAYEFVFGSGEEEIVTGFLMKEQFPNNEEWDRIFAFLDDCEGNLRGFDNVFRALRREHIAHMNTEQSDLLAPLGKQFADYCRELSFNFDYCDVLASKAQIFFEFGDIQLKANIAVAMLVLGVDHNRWFVEHKFVEMAGHEIPNELAARIAVEIDVLKIDFGSKVQHLERSINTSREKLHPLLRQKLS